MAAATDACDDAPFTTPGLEPIVAAIRAVGIPVRRGAVAGNLLPGVMIDRGALVVDEETLLFPGDVLHEAGHVAVLSPEDRGRVAGTLPKEGGEEMAALAWSYAMAVAFALPLEVVFHDAFKAGGPWLRRTFAEGHMIGVPLLQIWDMTRVPDSGPGFEHLPAFPRMARWLRPYDWHDTPSHAAYLAGRADR